MTSKPGRSAKELRSTAYHEAGHAVAHCEFRVPFKQLSIKADGDYLGSVLGHRMGKMFRQSLEIGFFTPGQRDRAERIIICSLAGPIAERRFVGRWNNVGAGSDNVNVADMIFRIADGPRDAQAYLNWLKVRAEELFDRPRVWPAVERIAHVALEELTLSRRQVHALWAPPIIIPDEVLARLQQN